MLFEWYNRIEGKNLFIIPSLPTWFVLSDEEAIALNLNATIFCDIFFYMRKLFLHINTWKQGLIGQGRV